MLGKQPGLGKIVGKYHSKVRDGHTYSTKPVYSKPCGRDVRIVRLKLYYGLCRVSEERGWGHD